jgi:DNA-binding MarR family transcriptional regulator
MAARFLSPQELRVWHAFQLLHEDVLARVGQDITRATGLSGPEFAVLSRLAGIGGGEMRQHALAAALRWDKSRLSHQLKRMETRSLVKRQPHEGKAVLVVLTKSGRETLERARPVHAQSVRKNLLERISAEQTATIVRISNLIGEEP